ncbi:MAG: [LysW]-aminoadipate kinase [Chloroflexi bacterium]|nr:[LysW]-aminoadipate kinase [Chloroflexota bacterium]
MAIHVLKLGGGAGNDHTATLKNLAARILAGEQWVLVHGVSEAANLLGEQVGYPAQTLTTQGGHSSRYTDARTIEIFGQAVGGLNQLMTAQLASYGVNAVGLGGPNIIRAHRKTAIRAIRDGRQIIVRDDHTGTISGVNSQVLRMLLDAGITPVVAPLAMGDEFERLNVDGDLVAANIAHAIEADALVILSNVPGLMRDINDAGSLVTGFPLSEYDRYESLAGGRMKKKLMAAQVAQVGRTILAASQGENPLDAALAGGGTQITNEEFEPQRR